MAEDRIVYEPIGSVTMGKSQPVIEIFAPMTLAIDGDKVVTYNPHRVVRNYNPNTEAYDEVVEPGLDIVGKVTKTGSGRSYNLNIFGKTQIINCEQYEQLKARKVGGISSVTVLTPMQANEMPTGVKSAFKRATDGTQQQPMSRRDRIQKEYSSQ